MKSLAQETVATYRMNIMTPCVPSIPPVRRPPLGRLLVPAITTFLSWGLLSTPARATSVPEELVRAELVSEMTSIQPGRPFWAAVKLRMREGWHVNWINPGDAGLAPNVEWVLPVGFEAGNIRWPYPDRFTFPELSIFGYEKSVLLMVEIRPPARLAAGPVVLQARVDWLACREACIPGNAHLRLELPVRAEPPASDPDWGPEFVKTRRLMPVASSAWRFSATVTAQNITINAIPSAGVEVRIREMLFYPATQGVIENSLEQKLKQTVKGYSLDIARSRISVERPTRIRGVLVSKGGWGPGTKEKALEIDVPVE